MTCCLVLVGAAFGEETPPALSVHFRSDPCTFEIRLTNSSDSALHYIDSFGKGLQEEVGIPGLTLLFVRDQEGASVSKLPWMLEDGYTSLLYRSKIDIWAPATLPPRASLSVQYSLRKLAIGLFRNVAAKKADFKTYQIKVTTQVYLDTPAKREQAITAETEWIPFPACLLNENQSMHD